MSNLDTKIQDIVRKTFNLPDSKDVPQDFKLGDIKEWDSLGNFRLLLALEQEFDIRFQLDEMASLSSVSGIASAVNALIENK